MDIKDFIRESNAIEDIYIEQAVIDSLEAWGYLKKQPINLRQKDIQWTHKLILKNLNVRIAGEIRQRNVQVGGRVCPNWTEVEKMLERLLIHTPSSVLLALAWHLDFEKIHPFEDGNGRIGRLIYAHHCYKLNKEPIMFREKDKHGYYSLFMD